MILIVIVSSIFILINLFSLNYVESKSIYYNYDRTRIGHGAAFRHHWRSPIRDHDVCVASVARCGRKSQHLHCRRGAHLHDCVRARTARSCQCAALDHLFEVYN